MINKREIVKYVKDFAVWNVVANATTAIAHTVIDEPTDRQDTGIELGSAFVGGLVAGRTKARTDQMIDSLADWRHNRKVAQTVTEVVA